jgi:MinD-like ATPase involved in chromosome partitioning or flagellar assembly
LDRRATSAVGYYNLICDDNGSGLLWPAARGVLSTVSGVLIASSASVDGAWQVAATLDWLRQNGYQRLLDHACIVINHLVPGEPSVDVADLTEQFQRYIPIGRVVVLPGDKHVAAGKACSSSMQSSFPHSDDGSASIRSCELAPAANSSARHPSGTSSRSKYSQLQSALRGPPGDQQAAAIRAG